MCFSKFYVNVLTWLMSRKIGYIVQTFNLIPVLTIIENVTLPTVFAGVPRDEGLRRAEKFLTLVGLARTAGQQQRVASTMAMVMDAAIILAG